MRPVFGEIAPRRADTDATAAAHRLLDARDEIRHRPQRPVVIPGGRGDAQPGHRRPGRVDRDRLDLRAAEIDADAHGWGPGSYVACLA